MTLLLISFIAGVLTVLAPCILPLLPVIVGGSVAGEGKRRVYVIIGSLIASVVIFTLLLKSSTLFVHFSPDFWIYFSGGLIAFVGLTMLFPGTWERLPGINRLSIGSNKLVGEGYQKKNIWGDVIIGAALGPVFSSCSPTYFVILATVLPANFAKGVLYLLVYALGLGISLFIISILGQKLMNRVGAISDPRGIFKKCLGLLFIIIGVLIMTGADKKLEAGILNGGFFDVTKIETKLLQSQQAPDSTGAPSLGNIPQSSDQVSAEKTGTPMPTFLTEAQKASVYPKYKEIVNPGGFVNTNDLPITISQYVGKKVILLDILDYTCINCQRTFPYLVKWNEEFQDKGLVIIGIHTPEFAFEQEKQNVEEGMKKFGITFPVVLDNNYGTWNAYQNEYWPHKYLIDIDGYVVYDHIGEGGYDETEMKIADLLKERALRLGENTNIAASGNAGVVAPSPSDIESPETYIGSARTPKNYSAEGNCMLTSCTFSNPTNVAADSYKLGGTWNIQDQYAELTSDSGSITYNFRGKNMYLVASGDTAMEGTVLFDGKPIDAAIAGADVKNGKISFTQSRLYEIVNLPKAEMSSHTVTVQFSHKGIKAYSFTFG